MIEALPLPYSLDALEPWLSTRTMSVHADQLARGYLERANEILAHQFADAFAGLDLVEIVHVLVTLKGSRGLTNWERALLHNVGGVYNHELLWPVMSPTPKPIPENVLRLFDAHGASPAIMRAHVESSAVVLEGSGWCWVGLDGDDRGLSVMVSQNQMTPVELGLTPLFGVDLWEHAYLYDYDADRGRYVSEFYDHIDWSYVGLVLQRITEERSLKY